MAYKHGITIEESPTVVASSISSATIPVITGTAPVNLVANPIINKPVLCKSYEDAIAAFGYSDDFENYTLCQAMDVFFKKFGVGPIVLINVLDPAIHKAAVSSTSVNIVDGIAKINSLGAILDSNFVVKDSTGTTTYAKGKDYDVSFDDSGYPEISLINGGTIPSSAESLEVSYNKIDPSKVTDADIIGGYTASTNIYKGIACVREIYPMFNLVPSLLLAPGWSQNKDVEAALKAQSSLINGCFNCEVLSDIDSSIAKVYGDAITWKKQNGYTDKREIALWPKIKMGDKTYWYSVIMAALIVYVDSQNNNVPCKSPSNKKIPIDSTVLADGTEVYLDQLQANELNAAGIVTAINMSGWRTWGNNTAAYPDDTDSKDRFTAIRRVLDWWGNNFILDFFDKVDDPTNYRLIESIVDEENIKANGYQAAGQIVGAKISFSKDDNPTENIQNGQIKFRQEIGAYGPAESIVNVLEFDPSLTASALATATI